MKRLAQAEIERELKLAREAYDRGDTDDSIRRIDLILKSNPESTLAHFARGSILMTLDRLPTALSSFLDALRYEPNNADALRRAAQISLRLQLPDQTQSLAKRLAHLEPNNDRAYFFLSIGLTMSGQWHEALEAIERSLALQPEELDYLVGKAQLLVKLHGHSLAIQSYRKALKIRPVPQIANELAEVLMEESYVPEAMALLERYALEMPLQKQPHILLGRAYTEMQRFEEAERYWGLAARFSADLTLVTEKRAQSEIWGGRLDVAEQILREALDKNPRGASYFCMLASIVHIRESDRPLVASTQRLLESGALDYVTGQKVNYALGKSYSDFQEFGRAMSYFDEANRLRRVVYPEGFRFERDEWKANTDFQIEYFTKKRIDALAMEGLDTDKPLFVVGMIRSGTTLTEQILSCHSQIAGGGESSFWIDHRLRIADLLARRFDFATGKRLAAEYLQELSRHGAEARYIIDKSPLNVLFGAPLHCLFPNAKMIHMKRHPVDNLLSIWTTPIASGLHFISTREDLVFAYREYLRLVKHFSEVLPESRFQTFTYEELTSSPVATIERMLRYLDLNSEAACFSPEKNSRSVRTPSVYQVRQPINTGSQAKWRQYETWLGPFAELLSAEDEVG